MHQKDINEIRQKDHDKLQKVGRHVDDAARSRAAEIQQKADKTKVKIQDLIDKKHEILRLPYSKAELLIQAKEALKEGKKQWLMETLLIPYLKKCQIGKGTVFADVDMRVSLAEPDQLWRYVFSIITEKDLEKAMESLEEIGISESEREVKVNKLDAEIAALETEAEKEVRSV